MIFYHKDDPPRAGFPFQLAVVTEYGIPVDLTDSTLLLVVTSNGLVTAFRSGNVPGIDGRVCFEPDDAFLDGLADSYSFELDWINTAGEWRTVICETITRHEAESDGVVLSDEAIKIISSIIVEEESR